MIFFGRLLRKDFIEESCHQGQLMTPAPRVKGAKPVNEWESE
jgi:hypothetical protein